jgi:hypothetical protein
MLSRADDRAGARERVRIWLERAAHVVALASVVWLLVQSLRQDRNDAAEVVGVDGLTTALGRWSTVAAPGRVHVTLDTAIAPATRDWLAALAAAGASVTWEGDDMLPLAAVAEPVADPAGGTRVWTAAPSGVAVVLEDGYGVLDSTNAGPAGARFMAQSTVPEVQVRAGALSARSATRDSLSFGRVLLLGRVGWEEKFVAAALEERGWRVDARLTLSPKGHVLQGVHAPIDTGRYAAVVVLDETALGGTAELARYVRSGGGLILAARASRLPAMGALRAGAPGSLVAAVEPFDSSLAAPRRALGLVPIAVRDDAVALERRDALVTVAARRVERGRVATIGYEDTWRWRMGGNANALEEHRAWWAGLVAGIAHVGRTPRMHSGSLDEAPLVNLLERLGPASVAPEDVDGGRRIPKTLLLAVFCAALLAEWLSRRLRGAP